MIEKRLQILEFEGVFMFDGFLRVIRLILCNGYITFQNFSFRCILPSGQAHVRLGGIGPFHNKFPLPYAL
jgi:hypothetical protein